MHDLAREALASKPGVTRQTVVSIENRRYHPSPSLAFRIARLFNITIEDVFHYQGSPGQFRGLPPEVQICGCAKVTILRLWWAILGSNQGPQSYQDCALTS